jgi:CubicO group peptidase (beta-lactamase class C family)
MRPARPARLAAAALFAAAALAAAPPDPYDAAIDESRALLDQVLQLYPGTAVAVAVGDNIIWSTAFGFADVDRQIPVSRATQFRVYEAAMPLTATLAEELAEAGRLDLDAPVQRYLPEVRDGGFPVTVRSLAAHLSGARDFTEEEEIATPGPCPSARAALRNLQGDLFVRPPGLNFTPSGPGYLMLSAVLEAVTGRTYAELLAQSIARPAGMNSTMIDDPRRVLPGRSPVYARGWFGLLRSARSVDTSCRAGAGGLVSTTADLVRFGAALLHGDFVNADTLEAMFTPQRTRSGLETGYGLGWHVDRDARGRRCVWQGGRGIGGRSVIVLVPQAQLVTVMLSNIEGARLDEHARRIAAYFLDAVEAAGAIPPDMVRALAAERPAPPFAPRRPATKQP